MPNFAQLQNTAIGFFDGADEKNNVVRLIERHAVEKPDGIAFRWADPKKVPAWGDAIVTDLAHSQITFKQFNGLIRTTATGLLEAGIKKGDRVIIFLPLSLPLYQTMAAVQLIGASVVFLDSWGRRDQLGVSARIANAHAMISFEMAFGLCVGEPELARIPIRIVVGPHKGQYTGVLDQLQAKAPILTVAAMEGEDTALITFTTGSSGAPKGANRTHAFLAAQHYALDACIPYHPADIDLPAFPIFSWNNLAAGVTTILPVMDIGRPSEKDPLMLVSQIISTGVTCATLSPAMMVGVAQFCAARNVVLPKVRRIITGGAPVSNDTLALMKRAAPTAEIRVLYGSTEVEPIAHIEANDILQPKHGRVAGSEEVEVGRCAEGLEVKFIKIKKTPITLENDDWAPWEVAEGQVGELVVAGLHVCKSYCNDPEAVAKTKIIESNGKVWHRTGDLAFTDPHGTLWLVGRVHQAIVRGGEMLFPAKVETLLKRHVDVKQAAFIGLPDPQLGEKAYALVQLKEGAEGRKTSILKDLEGSLMSAKVAFDLLDSIDSIPMDPRQHSKVAYGLLRDKLQKAGKN